MTLKSDSAVKARSRVPVLLAIALALAALVGVLLFNQSRQTVEVPQLIERAPNQLQLREGKLFDGDSPFSGIVVEHYDDNALKSRSKVSQGLLEGLSEGWHTNGVLQVTEHFTNGISHGSRTKFYANGNKLSAANVVNGQIEGLYQRWHENGALAEEVHLIKGIPHGQSLAFHPDGSRKARVRLNHGTVLEQQFWEPSEAAHDSK